MMTVSDKRLHGVVPESGTTPEARPFGLVPESGTNPGSPLMSYEDQKIKDLMERMEGRQDHEVEPSQLDIESNNLKMEPEEKKKYDLNDSTRD